MSNELKLHKNNEAREWAQTFKQIGMTIFGHNWVICSMYTIKIEGRIPPLTRVETGAVTSFPTPLKSLKCWGMVCMQITHRVREKEDTPCEDCKHRAECVCVGDCLPSALAELWKLLNTSHLIRSGGTEIPASGNWALMWLGEGDNWRNCPGGTN